MKLEDNKNILCTISAGYSSIMMALKIKEWYPDHKVVYVMANTSKEHKESLIFMNKCDEYFNLNMNWIEAEFYYGRIINGTKHIFTTKEFERLSKRNFFRCSYGYLKTIGHFKVGVKPRVVKYKDLKTKGEIFENGIKKLGISSKINAWCNRDMKIVPIKKFADSIFGLNNYSIAVGMRADEIDRVGKAYKTNNTFYPLLDNGITTKDRNKFWSKQPIKIEIPAYKGNCDLCYKKSNRKIMTVLKEEPDKAEWWNNMIKKYSQISIEGKPSYNAYAENGGMNFYRQNISLDELIKMASEPFKMATDEYVYENDLFDKEEDCGSGCSIF
jgi:3'-phosphoadenosine 5'-phosphosulfate sulfotransferase (PAPS reductase)/FAD synthetase